MANRSLHSELKFSRGMSPVAATTDNTAYTSQILDMKGYDSSEFVWLAGSIADADVTFTVLVEHGDNSALSDAAAVPDDQLTNTEASAAPTFGSDNAVGSIGYLGDKRYVRVTITPAGNTGNIFLAGVWVQGTPSLAPTV